MEMEKKYKVNFMQYFYMRREEHTTVVWAFDEDDAKDIIHGSYKGEIEIKSVKEI